MEKLTSGRGAKHRTETAQQQQQQQVNQSGGLLVVSRAKVFFPQSDYSFHDLPLTRKHLSIYYKFWFYKNCTAFMINTCSARVTTARLTILDRLVLFGLESLQIISVCCKTRSYEFYAGSQLKFVNSNLNRFSYTCVHGRSEHLKGSSEQNLYADSFAPFGVER